MSRDARLAWIVLGLLAVAAVCLIVRECRSGLPAGYDYDEGVYAATAAALAQGEHLYRDLFLSQPPLLVLALHASFTAFGTSLGAARAVAIAASFGWITAVVALLVLRRCPRGAAAVAVLLAGQAAFAAQGHTVAMEGPGEALACAALSVATAGLGRGGSAWWATAGALAALAAMTKLTAFTAVVPLTILLLSSRPVSRRTRAVAAAAAGAVAAIGAFLPVIATRRFVDQAVLFHVAVARAAPGVPEARQTLQDHLASVAAFLAHAWPLSLPAALGIIVALKRNRSTGSAFGAWALADLAVLIALTPLWGHHLVILFSPLAVLGGIGLEWLWNRAARLPLPLRPVLAAGVVAAVAAEAAAAALPLFRPLEAVGELAGAVRDVTRAVPPDRALLTDDPMVAFVAGRRLAAGLIDTSMTRIWAGEISARELVAALRDGRTDGVVLWRGTFRRYFPAVWTSPAADRFAHRRVFSGGRLLLLVRVGSGARHAAGGR